MTTKKVMQHVEHGLYGTPQINPDEQRQYLGTFRERCFLTMTVEQMKIPKNQNFLLQELSLHSNSKVRINGAIPLSLQTTYIKLITSQNHPFTIINLKQKEASAFGLVVASDEPVNEAVIDIAQKYVGVPHLTSHRAKPTFFQRLFHKNK